MYNINRNAILVGIAVLAIVVTAALIYANNQGNNPLSFLGGSMSSEEVAKKAVDNLNQNVLQSGQTATLVEFSEESGVVKVKLDISGQQYDSYATKDGKLFFPEAIVIQGANNNNQNGNGNQTGNIKTFDITQQNHVRGNFDAKVTLVEFSDFECPYCEKHTPTLERILAEYGNDVRLVYKHYPLRDIHPNAQKAAEASECAAEQGKFWEYHDVLFDNQPTGLSTDKFKQWAVTLGLNAQQFNTCLDSSKYADKVQADVTEGGSKGVNGTPATFVNGELISGSVPFDQFKTKIDAILVAQNTQGK